MTSRPLSAIAALALALAPGLAKADTVYFTGNGGNSLDPVSYSGNITVTGSSTSKTISVSLTNTTSTTVGDAGAYGYITGFGFNVPGTFTTVTGSSSDSSFNFLRGSSSTQNTSLQAGEFTYAFSTSPTVLHTVTDSQVFLGLSTGETATFTVTVNGTGASSLTAAAIAAATAPAGAPFSVRFRSTNGAFPGTNSDGEKVPFTIVPPPVTPPTGAVPAPAGLVLGLIGAGCFLGRKLRRKTVAKS